MAIKVGFGFDSHKLKKGKKLILGGVEIESEYGLIGVSDADVVIHALCDALLGAISEKDIGEHFPDRDEKNKGRASSDFLEFVKRRVNSQGYRIINIDITVILEKPHLASYKDLIRNNLTKLLGIKVKNISVKAKRTEGAFSKDVAVCYVLAILSK